MSEEPKIEVVRRPPGRSPIIAKHLGTTQRRQAIDVPSFPVPPMIPSPRKYSPFASGEEICDYVKALHHRPEDFYEGDIRERIEAYPRYRLKEIPISALDLDEWEWCQEEVDEFRAKYQETKSYPPIVVSPDMGIIDGTHRANALAQEGATMILAYVGVEECQS